MRAKAKRVEVRTSVVLAPKVVRKIHEACLARAHTAGDATTEIPFHAYNATRSEVHALIQTQNEATPRAKGETREAHHGRQKLQGTEWWTMTDLIVKEALGPAPAAPRRAVPKKAKKTKKKVRRR